MLTTDVQSTAISGRIVSPEDAEWDAARRTFNLLLDQQPVAIAFPSDERDTASIVQLARDQGLRVAPQATGHNAGPLGSLDGTILLNTSELTGVAIDSASKRVRVGAGTKWEAVIATLSDAGLAALHGSSPDVGIVGYSLGGGMGWLARKLGLQANSVTAIEMVTADGRLVRADATREPELFWALRGGGGSFGVVTSVEFAVYPVDKLYAGALLFPFERSAEMLRTWNGLLPSLPDEMTSWALLLHLPDLPFVPEPLRGGSFCAVMGAFLGGEARGRELLSPVRRLGPIMDTFGMVEPVELAELAMDPPEPLPYLSSHQLLDELPSQTIDRLVAAAPPSSQLGILQFRHMSGAIARPVPDAGARATLPGEICAFAIGIVMDEPSGATVVSSLEAVETILAPHSVGQYANLVEDPADPSQFFDPETWSRLRNVKTAYDPEDVFRGNHPIPAAS